MASGASATKGAGKLRQGQGQKARETSLVQEKTLSAGKAGMFLREGSSGLPEIVVNEGGALQEVLEAILFQPLQPDVIDSAWFGDQLQPWDMNVGMDAAPALKMALLNGQAVVANTALFLTDPAPGYTKALHIRVKVWPWWQAGAGGMLASGKYMAPGIGEKGFNADFQHFVAKPPPVFLTSENVFLDVLAPLKLGAFLDGGTFFKYSGSETLPPCLENVLWLSGEWKREVDKRGVWIFDTSFTLSSPFETLRVSLTRLSCLTPLLSTPLYRSTSNLRTKAPGFQRV